MPRRWLGWSIVLAFTVGGAVSMARQPADASARRSAIPPQGTWPPPLAADGHPDLQGVWLNNSATPLERPKLLAMAEAARAVGKPRATETVATVIEKVAA